MQEYLQMHTNEKNKRTYEKNAFQVETAEDLETLVSDKRLSGEHHLVKPEETKKI